MRSGKVNLDSPDKKNVSLSLKDERGAKISVTLPPKDAGMIAAGILGICRQIPAADNKPSLEAPGEWAFLRATHVTLGSSPEDGCEALVLGFGDAQLAVSMKREIMKKIGEAMIALSASGRPS